MTFRVDPQSRLPYSLTITDLNGPGKEVLRFVFDYPERGPADIYDLGVPRDAKLVDRVPPDDLARLLAGVNASRQRFDPYLAVVVHSTSTQPWYRGLPERVWHHGDRWRVEIGTPGPAWPLLKPDALDGDRATWWRGACEHFEFTPVALCDGTTVYQAEFSPAGQAGEPGKRTCVMKAVRTVQPDEGSAAAASGLARGNMPEFCGYPRLPIPSQQFAATLDPRPGIGPPDTVLLDIRATASLGAHAYRRQRYWFDPSRSYVAVQYEYLDSESDPKAPEPHPYVMEAFDRSPSGIWYPTIVRWKNTVHSTGKDGKTVTADQVSRFFLDFKADFPDRLFKP